MEYFCKRVGSAGSLSNDIALKARATKEVKPLPTWELKL
jgi:hypothetical protein